MQKQYLIATAILSAIAINPAQAERVTTGDAGEAAANKLNCDGLKSRAAETQICYLIAKQKSDSSGKPADAAITRAFKNHHVHIRDRYNAKLDCDKGVPELELPPLTTTALD